MASQPDDYGIKEIWAPADGTEPEVDIVAVHGLGGHAVGSWTSKESKVCWLNHPDFLPKYIKNARVLVWGYNASFSSLVGENPSKDRIHHHAQTLIANLAADRRLSRTADKPIIFLCHSLGGIIVKRALSYAQTRTGHKVAHDYSIFACTYAILFFGTPHHGTSKANWVNYMKRLGSAVTPQTLGSMSKSALLSALEHESETLQNITDYFVPLMRNFRIFFLWEQEQTGLKLLGRDYVVPQESAAPVHDDTERAGIAADHRRMVKFESPSSQGFRMVMDALSRYCEEAPPAILRRRAGAVQVLGMERQREAAETFDRAFQVRPPHVSYSSSAEDVLGFGKRQGEVTEVYKTAFQPYAAAFYSPYTNGLGSPIAWDARPLERSNEGAETMPRAYGNALYTTRDRDAPGLQSQLEAAGVVSRSSGRVLHAPTTGGSSAPGSTTRPEGTKAWIPLASAGIRLSPVTQGKPSGPDGFLLEARSNTSGSLDTLVAPDGEAPVAVKQTPTSLDKVLPPS